MTGEQIWGVVRTILAGVGGYFVSKGVVDGAMIPWEVATPLKLQEVSKVHVEMPEGQPKISNSIFVLAMNQAKYDSLPDDLKKVMDANSGLEVSRWAGKVFDIPTTQARKIAQERKNAISQISAEEYARWVKATAGVSEEWVAEAAQKGVANGRALYDEARALLRK